MEFVETKFAGAYLIKPHRIEDERGYFAKVFGRQEFIERNLVTDFDQCSSSFNKVKGTLRGMHFQKEPYMETKLVRVTRGAVFDVIIDLRKHSPTFGQWQGFELTEDNLHTLYIPKGFAHGFQTLVDRTEVFYYLDQVYNASSADGIVYNDPAISITWPAAPSVISLRDQELRPLQFNSAQNGL